MDFKMASALVRLSFKCTLVRTTSNAYPVCRTLSQVDPLSLRCRRPQREFGKNGSKSQIIVKQWDTSSLASYVPGILLFTIV